MDLNIVWFVLIAILFIGFFFLEGFDFGVGILLLFLGRKDSERRIIINTIGPFWDGNEVWLITAGGAIFAAFPSWYSVMFSGFYIALLVVLAALILRGVAFEFRSKKESPVWRRNWDYTIFLSSLTLAVLWGTALANLIKGVPIDKTMNFTGGFFDLISIYTIFAGITSLLVFVFHGAVFITLRTDGELEKRAGLMAKKLGLAVIAASILLNTLTFISTDLFNNMIALLTACMSLLLMALSLYLVSNNKPKMAMLSNGISIALGVGSLFIGLFPRVMVSSIAAEYSLTIYNSASSPYTLSLMTKAALIFVPIILAYQTWTYYIFRKKVSVKDLEY